MLRSGRRRRRRVGGFKNQIGRGYSPLDGYGFINAEAAVKAVAR
jgi:hypothetical protein